MNVIKKTFYPLAALDLASLIASIFFPAQPYFMASAIVLTLYLLFAAFAMAFHDHRMKSK